MTTVITLSVGENSRKSQQSLILIFALQL